jgi:glutaryl-CoA dehydrogenase
MNETSRKKPLNPHDLADLDSLLTQDEIAVRSSVRELCARRTDPYVAEWFEAGEIPDIRGLAKELGSLGLLGMHLQGYGCAGMSATDYGLACADSGDDLALAYPGERLVSGEGWLVHA